MKSNTAEITENVKVEEITPENEVSLPDKFEVRMSPYIREYERVETLMTDMIIALLPAFAWGVFAFGARALLLALISVVSSFGFELLARYLMHRKAVLSDLSSVITGLLIAMCLPVNAPLWMPAVGSFFAIVIVKQCFGGLGKNIFNPAVAAISVLSVGEYAISMFADLPGNIFSTADTALHPLAALKNGVLPDESIFDLFIGNCAGGIGEVSALFLIAGGVYLLFRRVITWQIPLSFIGSAALITLLFPRCDGSALEIMLCELFSGALILGAFFMATDHTASPVTGTGKLIFGVGCGILTVLIRYFGVGIEGVMYAILLMNMLTPVIEKITAPRPLGKR